MGHPMQRRTIEGISFVSTMVLVTLAFTLLTVIPSMLVGLVLGLVRRRSG